MVIPARPDWVQIKHLHDEKLKINKLGPYSLAVYPAGEIASVSDTAMFGFQQCMSFVHNSLLKLDSKLDSQTCMKLDFKLDS